MTDQDVQSEPTPLVLEAFGWGPDVKLRVPPEDSAEVRKLMDEAGVPYSQGAEFSQGPVVDLLSAVVEQQGAWEALGGVIVGYLGRNAARSVRVGDIVVRGHKKDESLRIIEELQSRQNRNRPPQNDE